MPFTRTVGYLPMAGIALSTEGQVASFRSKAYRVHLNRVLSCAYSASKTSKLARTTVCSATRECEH